MKQAHDTNIKVIQMENEARIKELEKESQTQI